MAHVRACGGGVLYQSVAPLEDSFDFEGMMAAAAAHAQLSQRIENALNGRGRFLHLTAGGCHLCRRCTAPDGERWTLRKLLRRFLWHDRIHARAMWRTAAPLWGSAVADPFGFR